MISNRLRSLAPLAVWAALWLAPTLAWSLLAPTRASAQIQGVRPEGHLDLALYGDPGVGARVDIPIVPNGILDAALDELAISPGVDLLINHGHAWLGLPVALQWNFYLEQKWSVFPELGAALFLGSHHKHGDVNADILVAVGGRYHLNDRNALVLRLGWPFGIQFGVTF